VTNVLEAFWASVFFFGDQFLSVCQNYFKKEYSVTNFLVFENKKSPKIVTIAYNMKGCLIFFYCDVAQVSIICKNI
jgi:hypothetical protein